MATTTTSRSTSDNIGSMIIFLVIIAAVFFFVGKGALLIYQASPIAGIIVFVISAFIVMAATNSR